MAMNPSTYAQVRENMENLLKILGDGSEFSKLFERLDEVEQQLEKITNPTPGSGDITTNPEGNLIVYGVTIVTQFANSETTPESYTRDVTFELKSPAIIGLTADDGFSAPYVLMVTYKHNLAEGVEVDEFTYRSQQVAYGDNMVAYTRTANEDNSAWGEWGPQLGTGAGTQWIESTTEPVDQDPGGYWCEPIT